MDMYHCTSIIHIQVSVCMYYIMKYLYTYCYKLLYTYTLVQVVCKFIMAFNVIVMYIEYKYIVAAREGCKIKSTPLLSKLLQLSIHVFVCIPIIRRGCIKFWYKFASRSSKLEQFEKSSRKRLSPHRNEWTRVAYSFWIFYFMPPVAGASSTAVYM